MNAERSIPAPIHALLRDAARRTSVVSDTDTLDVHRWVLAQPKVETHVHLEAACGAALYRTLYRPETWGTSVPWERAPFDGLRAFILAWVDLTRAVIELPAFEAMAEAFVAERHAANIVYTEAYCSPADFSLIRERFAIAPQVFAFEDVLRAYVRGLRRGLARFPGVEVRLVVDALWIAKDREHAEILTTLRRMRDDPEFHDATGAPYVVAVGFGGMETHERLDEIVDFAAEVRRLGYAVDAHSGEGCAPATHATTLERLRPDRVAHGFSGFDQHIVFERNLVACPLSNLLLRTFRGTPETHPVFSWLARGVPVAVGSDDPLLLGHDLAWEFAFLHAIRGKGEVDFRATQAQALAGALAPHIARRVSDSASPPHTPPPRSPRQ